MKNIPRYILVAVVVWSLTISAFALPAWPVPQTPSDAKAQEKADKEQAKKDKAAKDKEAKEAAAKDKAEQKAGKQEREYQKLLENGKKKYDTNPEFKARVDEDYKALRRRDSEVAFQINTFDTQDERTTFTGDKLKTEDTLYDSPLVQDYVNRVGQSLVPANSQHRFAFKVIMNPVPDARSLSTGTIYITTGLLSLVDNEAQLSYLLAHEISHIEKLHWLQDALVANEMEDFNRAQESKQIQATGIASMAGRVFGGATTRSVQGASDYAFLAGLGTAIVMKFVAPTKVFAWDRQQENEADEYGLKLIYDRNYDPREVPKLFARLRGFAELEPRTGEGFMAQVDRVNERLSFFNPLLEKQTLKPNMNQGAVDLGKSVGVGRDIEKREQTADAQAQVLVKVASGELIGSTAEFESVMADLKRDNGVRAFYYDMFRLALKNLRESLEIRSNDPYTHFYYGKVLNLTARNRAEKAKAMASFVKAIEYDQRGVLSAPWLHRALALMADRNPSQNEEIVGYLKRYVDVYQQEHSGAVPPNMDAIYAYMKDLGEDKWVARSAINISTKNMEPIETLPSGRATPQPTISTPISAPPQTTTTPATTPAKNTPATTPAKGTKKP